MTPRVRRALAALCLLLSAACAGTAVAQVKSDFARSFGDELTKGIQRGDADAVSRALIRGYNPSKRYYAQGITPLMLAAQEGQPEIADMLLGYGANIRTRDKMGNSALLYAAAGGHFEAVEVLLDNGASIDARNRRGETALISTALNGHTFTVEVLLGRGADPTLTDHTGRTALECARQNRHRAIIKMLEKLGS